jgi:hypothetical protein
LERLRLAVQTVPSPTNTASSSLTGVSCPTSRSCTAVGESDQGDFPLAEEWDGSTWQVQPIPTLTPLDGSLNAVSCATRRMCVAVGGAVSATSGTSTPAERWNGSSWRVLPTPNPAGGGSFNAVSCPTARVCTAIGEHSSLQGMLTFAERWAGGTWQIQSTVNPAPPLNPFQSVFNSLLSVSCPTSRACTAVGAYEPAAGTLLTLAERWDGTGSQVQSSPNSAGSDINALNGVSCAAARSCTAVGDQVINLLAEHWDGTSWVIQPLPTVSGASGTLSAVSCAKRSACIAVGNYNPIPGDNGLQFTLAERYSATR